MGRSGCENAGSARSSVGGTELGAGQTRGAPLAGGVSPLAGAALGEETEVHASRSAKRSSRCRADGRRDARLPLPFPWLSEVKQ